EYNLKMLPEVGRCKQVGRGGEFRRGGGVQGEATGTWDWFSGPGAKPKFTGTAKGRYALALHGAGPSASVVCQAVEAAGEYTGPKNLKATLTFTTCTSGEGPCQNKVTSPAGQVATEPLVGELGFILRAKKRV